MSGTLVLVGGGEWSEGCVFDRTLIEVSGATAVAVLPTGSAYESPARLVATAREWFGGLGVSVVDVGVLTRRDALDGATAEVLRAARMIYLAGSSAMHLRAVLKDTPVFEAMLAAWSDGAVLVGTNAGADVLCDPMVDSRGGAFTVGLGVVPGLAVIPRLEEWSHDKVHRTVELAPAGVVLAGVPSATALMRDPDGGWSVDGVGEVRLFLDGRPAVLGDLPG